MIPKPIPIQKYESVSAYLTWLWRGKYSELGRVIGEGIYLAQTDNLGLNASAR